MPTTTDQLQIWRSRLLDLSRRNRLLHLRPGAPGALALTHPPAAELLERLTRGRTLDFAESLTLEQRLDALSWAAPATGATVRLDQIAPAAPKPDQIATDRPPAELERALYNLRVRARTCVAEQGVNALYVAVGFLEWFAPDGDETFWRSPLLLLPVELRRASFSASYSLRLADDEAVLNPTLAHKLSHDFGIELPALPADPDEIELAPLLEQIAALVAGRDGWQVTHDLALGMFSYLKLLMYHDLGQASAAAQHPLVGLLAGDPQAQLEDDRADPQSSMLSPHSLDARPPEHCYQVLDADSSQAAAIAAARAGASFVLQGPPGTGKSQTITNIIAELLAEGKRVLFVSEKLAALQVVHARLAQSGLDEFCLELHSHKANKRAVLATLGQSLSATPPPLDPAFAYAELASLREQLNEYTRALHAPDQQLGWTPFSVHGRLGMLADAPALDTPISDFASYTPERLGAADALLARIDARAELLQSLPANVWRGCALDSGSFEQRGRVRARLRALLAALAEAEQQAGLLAGTWGLPSPAGIAGARALLGLAALLRSPAGTPAAWLASPGGAERRRALIAEAAAQHAHLLALEEQLAQRYQAGLLELDLAGLLERFSTQHSGWSRLLRPQFHRDIAALRAQACPGVEPTAEQAPADLRLAIELRAARAQAAQRAPELAEKLTPLYQAAAPDWPHLTAAAEWQAELLALGLPAQLPAPLLRAAEPGAPPPAAEPLAAALARLDAELAFLEELRLEQPALRQPLLGQQPFAALQAQISALLERMADLDAWWEYSELRRAAEPLGLADFLEVLSRDPAAAAQPRRAFQRRFCEQWLDQAYQQSPQLRGFRQPAYQAMVERFRQLDYGQLAATQLRLRRLLATRRPNAQAPAPPGSELATLRRELQKQRAHKPIRQLFREIPALLGQLRPCLLMSPLSVSQFLDPSLPPFDLVIFDEASQIRTEDAIGAIARGHALVVVGDNRQLPPTSFFSADTDAPEDDQAEDAGAQYESILDAASASGLPSRLLRWHYRSRDEALITFSNEHFYNAQLATFPSAGAVAGRGVALVHVAEGIYDRQGSRTNPAEARQVADLVIAQWRAAPQQSLGVVTFSQAQQLAVLHELERRRAADEALAGLLDEARAEPFFVKNLENVQGDERDVMIISVGYGRDSAGRLLMNFGPLNQQGGERRLNVAITRARDRVVVVSSLLPEEIDLRRVLHPGPRLLREYLAYAQRGGPAPLPQQPPAQPARTVGGPTLLAPPRFEDRLAVALARRGLLLARQIGHSDFRIDIAVRDPADPQRFLLGIECDGEDYRSAPTARDRERLREQVLGTLGWRILRAWSAAWARDPAAEVARVLDALGGESQAP